MTQATGQLQRLYERHFGRPPEKIEPIHGGLGGSARRIFRLKSDRGGAIGVANPDRRENRAFLGFTRHFRDHGLPVPEIYAENLEESVYLEEDLGDTTLYESLRASRHREQVAPDVVALYRKVVGILPRFQVDTGRDLDYGLCYPRHSFDRQSIAWDLNYFKYYFLKLAGIPFDEQALEDDFARLTDFLLEADRDYFLYRDFQSRNVMVRDGEPFFIDYQGGRRGALQYDIASLLYDAKADLSPALREELLDDYLEALSKHIELDRESFMRHYHAYVYVRIMQALGAYGYRGFFERKAHFLQSVPHALGNLRWLLHNVALPIETPTLIDAFKNMLASDRLHRLGTDGVTGDDRLSVRIFSFSFHQEAPTDASGHGGGFVFDTRCLPNPGREKRFEELTGRDPAVIEYLSGEKSVQRFLEGVTMLIDPSVRNYQERGFRSLMVSFGCTGGRHRSVFLAERLAEHVRGMSRVDVSVTHLALKRAGR